MFEKSKSVLGLWLSELETPFEAVGPSRPAPKSPRGLSGCQGCQDVGAVYGPCAGILHCDIDRGSFMSVFVCS